MDGETPRTVLGVSVVGELPLESSGERVDFFAQERAIFPELWPVSPCLPGRRSAQCTPVPEVVQCVLHGVEDVVVDVVEGDTHAVEPLSVFAVLTFELAVEARVVGRSVQDQDTVLVEHVGYFVDLVTARAVESQHQRGAVFLDVFGQDVEHGATVVVVHATCRRAVRDGAVGGYQGVAVTALTDQVHRIEAPHDARQGHGDAPAAGFAGTLTLRQDALFDGLRAPPRHPREGQSKRLPSDSASQVAYTASYLFFQVR